MIPFDRDQADWGSRFSYTDGNKLPWNVDKWVIHYGGGANPAGGSKDEAKETAVLRGWQNWHVDGRGWQDIAYNYAIGQTGLVYRLRGENRAGATSGDYEGDGIPENHEARAVVFILGGTQAPTQEALDAFARIWRADPLPVIGHRDVKSTACPGDALYQYVQSKEWEQSEVTIDDVNRIVVGSEKRIIKTLITALVDGKVLKGKLGDKAVKNLQESLDSYTDKRDDVYEEIVGESEVS